MNDDIRGFCDLTLAAAECGVHPSLALGRMKRDVGKRPTSGIKYLFPSSRR